jgi:hypothetical protein
VGKEKIHQLGVLSQRLVLLAVFAALAVQAASCSSGGTLTYTGLLVPRAGACDASTRAVLLRKKSHVQFVPKDGVIVLEGSFSGNDFVASRQLVDMNHAPYSLRFTGQMHGDHIIGAYVTPRCRYDIDLAPASG